MVSFVSMTYPCVYCDYSVLRVWAWRPNPPSVPPQLLKKKRLQPLGWVFTTTAAPPDVENVAVVSEAFLDSVSPTVLGQPEEVDEPSAVDPTGELAL